jgi:uncharacterized protein (TIGR00369 family)
MSYLEKITTDGRSANPFFCLMGIDIKNVEPGKAVLRMQVRPDMHNGVGWLQGGMLAALADEAMDVLDHHDTVVDQHAQGQYQAEPVSIHI